MRLKAINRHFLRKNLNPRRRRLLHFSIALICAVIVFSTQYHQYVKANHVRCLMSSSESCKHHPTAFEKKSIPGAVILWVLIVLYAFMGIAIVCDEHFMPALEKISEKLHLSEDVAGATFLAAAGSAPELFSNTVDTFAFENSIGVGTIVGSAMFNILIIIAAAAVVAPEPLKIDWRPFARDVTFYSASIALVLILFADGKVWWWESIIFLSLYALYLVYMVKNVAIMSACCPLKDDTDNAGISLEVNTLNHLRASRSGSEVSDISETSSLRSAIVSSDIDGPSATRRKFRAAVIAVTIANRADSTAHLSAQSTSSSRRNSQSQGASQTSSRKGSNATDATPSQKFRAAVRVVVISRYLMNKHRAEERADGQIRMHIQHEDDDNDTDEKKEISIPSVCAPIEEVEEGEAEEDAWYLTCPSIALEWLSKPLVFIFKYTIPPCQEARWEKWYMLSFFMSIIWIAAMAMAMVTLCTFCGCLLGISPIVLGVTFLAVGTSVPDALGSILAAKEGMGGMACSNAIGSNVFDICIGLGLPWLIKTVFFKKHSHERYMAVSEGELVTPIIILFSTVGLVIIIFIATGFRLTKGMGVSLVFLYLAYIVYSLWDGIAVAMA